MNKKVGNSALIETVINSTIAVENKFDEYIVILGVVINEVDEMIKDMCGNFALKKSI